MAVPLPFSARCFDAVMSNVAWHMYPDMIAHGVFAEVGRLVRPDGQQAAGTGGGMMTRAYHGDDCGGLNPEEG
jgi:SAM-dependent methyltransferase